MDVMTGFFVTNGALSRFKNHMTILEGEPQELVNKQYYLLTQTQLVTMFKLVKKDTCAIITEKMTKMLNDFFRNVSDADGEIFRKARSQQQITNLSNGAIKPVPHIAMVRVQLFCVTMGIDCVWCDLVCCRIHPR